MSAAPAVPSQEADGVPRLFRSPLQLSDAVRRLAVAANDNKYEGFISNGPDGNENILRVMNSLLSLPQSKSTLPESAQSPEITQNNYSLLQKKTRTTIVYIKDRSSVVGAHRALAAEYIVHLDDPLKFCRANSDIARRHLRNDHVRVFNVLATLFEGKEDHRTVQPPLRYRLMPSKPTDIIIETL